jgi:hypothetical protein
MEEAVINDLDTSERGRVLFYLRHSDPDHPLVPVLKKFFEHAEALPVPRRNWVHRLRHEADDWYREFIVKPWASRVIDAAFIVKALLALTSIGLVLADVISGRITDHTVTVSSVLQFVSSVASTVLITLGVIMMRRNRLYAYELFLKAMLIDIFVTQFFAFYREGFNAFDAFVINLLLYVTLRILISEERRLELSASPSDSETTVQRPHSVPSR